MTVEINYQTVSRAISAYTTRGYKYVDTPWHVSADALTPTLPRERWGFSMWHPELPHDKFLVGSAEQGFLQLMLNGEIQPGSYSSAGPCFRDEPVIDELHRYSFFKVELIKICTPTETVDEVDAWKMAQHAAQVHAEVFFATDNRDFHIKRTDAGYDLELKGIEVGSYGTREHAGHRWLYGTGLALPRAQIARAKPTAI